VNSKPRFQIRSWPVPGQIKERLGAVGEPAPVNFEAALPLLLCGFAGEGGIRAGQGGA